MARDRIGDNGSLRQSLFISSRDAHGSGTGGYGSELPVPVLENVELEPYREGVLRLRFRFQNRRL